MTQWSIEQTTIALVKAGFPRSVPLLTIATAICWAESSFNPEAIGPINHDGSRDYGLYQINNLAHKELFQKWKWDDGFQNCHMARTVYIEAGASWHPWSTYNDGSYKKYLDQCRTGVINGLKGDPGGVNEGPGPIHIPNPIDSIEGALSQIGGVFSAIGSLIGKIFDPSLWARIGLGLLGVGITFAGLWMLFEGTDTGKAATKAVGMAAMA